MQLIVCCCSLCFAVCGVALLVLLCVAFAFLLFAAIAHCCGCLWSLLCDVVVASVVCCCC